MKFLFILLTSILSYAQIKTNYLYEFGSFSNSYSFTISSNGILFITDIDKNEIISYDTLGNKLKDIGGFGWQFGLFDQPVDIFANPLAVFVADKNNHRVQQFDISLNYVGSFSNLNEDNLEFSFGFPLSVAISNQGDMFILDGENYRIIKFDMFGNFLTSFAGLDAGRYRIKKPQTLSVDSKGLVYVADDKTLNIYDSFGNGLNQISFDSQIRSVRIINNNYVILTKNKLYILLFENEAVRTDFFEINDVNFVDIKSALIFNNKLYLLLYNKIKIFSVE